MASLLTSEICGWPIERIEIENDPAKSDGLFDKLVRWYADATDVALFYFVGHGQLWEEELCLALRESPSSGPRCGSVGLRFSDVRKAMLASPAQTKIVILDCCFSGTATLPPYTLAATSLDEVNVSEKAFMPGAITIAASAATRHAWHEPDHKDSNKPQAQTYFTKYLIDTIEREVWRSTEGLTLREIYDQTAHELARSKLPLPTRSSRHDADRFVLARRPIYWQESQGETEARQAKIKAVTSSRISGILSLRRRRFQSRPQRARHRLTMWGILLAALMVLATVATMDVLSGSSSGSMKQLWSLDAGTAHGSQNSYIGSWASRNLVAVGFTHSITGYSLNSGKELWVWAPPAGQQLCEMSSETGDGIGMIAYESDRQASATSGYKICQAMTAINLATGRDSWASPVSLAPEGSVNTGSGEGIVIEGDTVATLEGDDNIYGYSLSTGAQLWSSASAYPRGNIAACGSKMQHFNYSNIAGSGSSVYVDYSCWAGGSTYLSYILGFSASTGASTLNITLTGACKAVGVSGLWYSSGNLIGDCGKESPTEDSFEIIGPSNSQLNVTIPTDTTDTLQSFGNQTGQILSQRFVTAGDSLYAEGSSSTGANTVLAIDLNSGQTLWSRPVSGSAELSFIGVTNSRPLTVLCEDTPSQTPEIAMATYTSTGEAVGSSLASPAVTASSGDTFLEDGTDLVDINGSASGTLPFITVYSNVHAG